LKLIEANVFSNKKIWFPHNEKNYQISFAIVEHSKQEIGLSLWNFAIMSRSMILTVGIGLVFNLLILFLDCVSDDHIFGVNFADEE
jgi:hypothetical protein